MVGLDSGAILHGRLEMLVFRRMGRFGLDLSEFGVGSSVRKTRQAEIFAVESLSQHVRLGVTRDSEYEEAGQALSK